MSAAPPQIILASSSAYRRAQLARIGIEAFCVAPDIDELALAGEPPGALALRLAANKAQVVAHRYPQALVIGSDQVAVCGDRIHGKPGTALAQRVQLAASAGRELRFLTAVCIVQARSSREFLHLDTTLCRMRSLDAAEIARYVAAEPADDCAGGFKIEGRGILLFDSIVSEDPSALIGLPLIALRRGFEQLGYPLP